jgi:hypothetical protein
MKNPDAGLVAQLLVDSTAEWLGIEENLTHPEQAADGSHHFEFYPDESGTPDVVYQITVRRL